jgi:hypothetical protein
LAAVVTLMGALALFCTAFAQTPSRPLDPAAWGADHAGRPMPEYVPGDECLFCHRSTVGSNWKETVHGAASRHRDDAPKLVAAVAEEAATKAVSGEVEYVLGSRHRARFLDLRGFGTFALLNAQAVLRDTGTIERWIDAEKPAWDATTFANRCAGCHATAVDAKTKTFAAFGLDCVTCHGAVTLDHTNDTSLMWWSQKRRNSTRFEDVAAMTSICAQCHLRGGQSRSTGLPYPNGFVAGDNLFKDFVVDFARADAKTLNPGDRHVWRAVRDVVVTGQTSMTCTLCHRVHDDSSARHALVARSAICADCHAFDGAKASTPPYTVDSELCQYAGVAGEKVRGK